MRGKREKVVLHMCQPSSPNGGISHPLVCQEMKVNHYHTGWSSTQHLGPPRSTHPPPLMAETALAQRLPLPRPDRLSGLKQTPTA